MFVYLCICEQVYARSVWECCFILLTLFLSSLLPGKINKDETEMECAVREVLEETGFFLFCFVLFCLRLLILVLINNNETKKIKNRI